ncbi:MAG: hypothetical protein LBJ73_05405 [Rickettsiales bacterium]|nr:hypothetical protein [Rickettsiales bacterium]
MKKIIIISALLLISNQCFSQEFSGYFFDTNGSVRLGSYSSGSCSIDRCVSCGSITNDDCKGNNVLKEYANNGDTLKTYGSCSSSGSGGTTLICCDNYWVGGFSCTACAGSTGYSDVSGQNYQSETYGGTCSGASCSNKSGTCSGRSVRYRCKSGYYGTGTSCTQCPESSDIFTNSAKTIKARGTNTAGSNETLGTCQLPVGTYYDATGTVDISAGCSAS